MVREKDVKKEAGSERCYIVDFEDGEGGHEPRNLGCLNKL